MGILGKSRSNKLRFDIFTILPLFAVALGIIGVYVYPYLVQSPNPILDLSQLNWSRCYSLDSDADCDRSPIHVPSDVTVQKDSRFTGDITYFTEFNTPVACLDGHIGCTIFFSEVGDSASVELNQVVIATHGSLPPKGKYAKHYPLRAPIASTLLSVGAPNKLVIRVHSFKNVQAGIRKGPAGIFTADDAFVLARTQVTQNIFIPLLAGGMIVLLALGIAMFTLLRRDSDPRLRALLLYCSSISFFLFSFTELPREILPVSFAGFFHFFSRVLSDKFYFDLVSVVFYPANKKLRNLSFLYYLPLIAYPILFLKETIDGSFAFRGFDDAYLVTRFAVPLLFLPHLLGLKGALGLSGRKRAIVVGLFAVTTLSQLNDSLIFHAYITGTYFVKAYPLAIALILSVYILSDKVKSIIEHEATTITRETLAKQLVHDIRSPLAALELSLQSSVSTDRETVARNAISRIKDITRDLMMPYRGLKSPEVIPVFELIRTINVVTDEKRATFSNEKISIQVDIDELVLKFSCRFQRCEISRIVSNLLNNAVEAFPAGAGSISIEVGIKNESRVIIRVKDDGIGIPKKLIKNIGGKAFSFNKEHGSGLGLSHAFAAVESWGGSVSLESTEDFGTTVEIALVACPIVLPVLHIRNRSELVVVDDDPDILPLWEKLLSKTEFETKPKILHFRGADEFEEFYKDNFETLTDPLFVFDYNLGSTISGLDLIEKFSLQESSVIATVAPDVPGLRLAADKLKLQVYAKSDVLSDRPE